MVHLRALRTRPMIENVVAERNDDGSWDLVLRDQMVPRRTVVEGNLEIARADAIDLSDSDVGGGSP